MFLTNGFTLFADNAGVIVNPKGEMKGKLECSDIIHGHTHTHLYYLPSIINDLHGMCSNYKQPI